MEVERQWHLLDTMKFIQPHIVSRPIRFSQNICETDQGHLQSATEDSRLQPHEHAQEVEVASPLWSNPPISPLVISLPSPSPPVAVAPSPTPSSSTLLPSPSCSTQVVTQKDRKRDQSGPTNSEVDEKMMEAIEIKKKKWSTQTTPQIQQQQSTSPAVQSFCTLAVSILNKMDETKQARAIEKMLLAAYEVHREE